jgi:hypothetical protein
LLPGEVGVVFADVAPDVDGTVDPEEPEHPLKTAISPSTAPIEVERFTRMAS